MSYVPSTTEELTGKYRLVTGFGRPKIRVQVKVSSWDTNTGISDPTRIYWRNAVNADIPDLDATPAKNLKLCKSEVPS